MKAVVVVESPAKAKTISKYLGTGYHVVASYGHIRDLPVREGSVRPEENFAMDWEVDAQAERHFQDIAKAIHGASQLYLATDPDREGEAISWHVREELRRRSILDKDIDIKRITFHEITRDAVQNALRCARDLNGDLIESYLARRALDYLVGFTLSPVLWRKLPGSRSAGRVQSVALRLICEREVAIERFTAREYWTIEADLFTSTLFQFSAYLTHLDGKRLEKFAFSDEKVATEAKMRVEAADFSVREVRKQQNQRYPPPPFTTSTLQQEAARHLHFSAKRTMHIAQRLYEGVDIGDGETIGLITYMRTDSVQITSTLIDSIRNLIQATFGVAYQPVTPRVYKTKVKNAQEAHEAIRPTDINRSPHMLSSYLEQELLQLYELIWKRTVASQMANTEITQTLVDIISADQTIVLRSTNSVVTFDGFLCLYLTEKSADINLREKQVLPITHSVGDKIYHTSIHAKQHFTQPEQRYSEASLVKRLEELGIGRPSTYATILSVLQDRNYVRMEDRRFIPENRGRIVTAFLENYFNHYIQYTFTANLEDRLDDISEGRIGWKMVLRQFWEDFILHVENTKNLRISTVLDKLDSELEAHFFPRNDAHHNPRQCPTCIKGRLSLKLGRFGAFIGCSNYPACSYTRPFSLLRSRREENGDNVRILGLHPEIGTPISLRQGPYGSYVQLDSVPALNERNAGLRKQIVTKKKATRKPRKIAVEKPRRVHVPESLCPITLETAIQLLALPREIGLHNGQPIFLKAGRYGLYVEHRKLRVSLPPQEIIYQDHTITCRTAIALLTEKEKNTKKRSS